MTKTPNRSLILFLHVPKAGGSSVVSFLRERTIFWHYGLATCWMALHSTDDTFPPAKLAAVARAANSPRCVVENEKRTQHESLRREPGRAFSVEFHVDSDRWFWIAAAQRSKLLATGRYARVVACTLIREPAAALLSRYRFWPPYTWHRSAVPPQPRVVLPLLTYLRGGPFPKARPPNFTVFARAAAGLCVMRPATPKPVPLLPVERRLCALLAHVDVS